MEVKKIGISGLAAYVPQNRVWLEDWCQWTDSPWPKIRDVVGRSFRMRSQNHSVYTMAASAVLRLIRQYDIDPSNVRYLGFGTESSTDNSAGAIIIKGMIDDVLISEGKAPIARSCEVPEYKHACLGGVYGMKGALRYLALDGAGSQAIVVCADIAEYARGSSGEPTQGAGAVAMLLEEDPTIFEIDLTASGSASDYRSTDFRKPMLRFCGQDRSETHQVQDFPVFNGKYSTTCYIDETLHALRDMCTKRGLNAAEHLSATEMVFMHRPYRRMPETGLAVAWLYAMCDGSSEDRAQLAALCHQAGIEPGELIRELHAEPAVAELATAEDSGKEAYPLTMALLRAFRTSTAYRARVLDKLALGSDPMLDLGNLYTAALPAWICAGLEEAVNEGRDLANRELLTFGYGSGDAAEVIPFRVVHGWEVASAKIGFSDALAGARDLTQAQYERLHDGKRAPETDADGRDEFVIDHVGEATDARFQDIGIEYYRFGVSPLKASA
ncbi:MAG: hydroxymethylglutaryl-CoA synthase [Pseudomonadota bacterium]